jgi:DNA-binding NtrC family response regulator
LKTVNKALENSPKYVEPLEEKIVQSGSSPTPVSKPANVEPIEQALEGEFISGIAKTYFDLPLREARDLFEKAYFEHQMQIMGGSMTKISEYTGLERTHLYRKLKALGIDTSRNKSEQ